MPMFPKVNRIPKEALVAPTQAAWDAMSEARRREVIEELVCSTSQEEQDQADAMAESDEHYDAKEEIRGTLRNYFDRTGRSVYVGAERKVIYPGEKGFAPDILAVVDVSPHKRDCWMVSEEGRGVDVIIEVFYKGDWKKDFVSNVTKYAGLAVPEYFIYDVMQAALTAYGLREGQKSYEPLRKKGGLLHSEKLGLGLTVRRGRLRFVALGGALVPTPAEVMAELTELAEQEQTRAEQQQTRAHEEQMLAEESLAQLRAAVLALLSSRGIRPSKEQTEEMDSCRDPLRLRRFFDRALSAQTSGDVFDDA